ncbi:MAG: rod shape-determining protein MreC [Patescibacteria group bacterium]|nr:rod shape-determining protein MreC [Patescibacteria group bacterium]MDE1988151.1 rod shape-determining protein MreC [Patescibacteria group bacterium]MDE2217971.1 rod shape-determining protein MreC [Patescibacteria group bacterium]
MNYLLKNNRKASNKKWQLKAVVAILIFAVFFFVSRAPASKGFLNGIALPFWGLENYTFAKFSEYAKAIGSNESLISENQAMKEELEKNKTDLAAFKIVQKENDDLKALLGRNDSKRSFVLAAVLVKPSISPFDVIIIDIGKNKGAKAGDKVLYNGMIAIGEIEEAYDKSSKVKLYSSSGEKVIALIGPKSTQTEAEGIGGGNFTAKLPRDAEVKEGDAAVVPSISTSVFGFAQKIEINPAESFQKIIFRMPVNLSELKWVEVETSSNN